MTSSESGSDSESSQESNLPRKRRKLSHEPPHAGTSLVDDCPPFSLLHKYVPLVAGASLTAARQLRDGLADVAISWNGGRHHASRGEAKGFCYVNDIVLAIMELRKKPVPRSPSPSPLPSPDEPEEEKTRSPRRLPRPSPPKKLSKILYLDLDLHHGDAVETAFLSSPYILTLSLHLHAPLFYPSTGSLDSSGPTNPKAAGKGHALNLALESGLSGDALRRVFETVENVKESFAPDAVVVQCGIDGLNGDPCKVSSLSRSDGLCRCAEVIRPSDVFFFVSPCKPGVESLAFRFRQLHLVRPRVEPSDAPPRRWRIFISECGAHVDVSYFSLRESPLFRLDPK